MSDRDQTVPRECPFCESTAILIYASDDRGGKTRLRLRCAGCGAEGPSMYVDSGHLSPFVQGIINA